MMMGPQDHQQLRQEIIYAPVAELQHKINQRHNPGPAQVKTGASPEGEQYGFGVQFQHQQNQFYHHHVQDPHQRYISIFLKFFFTKLHFVLTYLILLNRFHIFNTGASFQGKCVQRTSENETFGLANRTINSSV